MTDEELENEIWEAYKSPREIIEHSAFAANLPIHRKPSSSELLQYEAWKRGAVYFHDIAYKEGYLTGRRKTLAELKEAFEAGVNSWVNDFEVYDFDDWYKTRGEKL